MKPRAALSAFLSIALAFPVLSSAVVKTGGLIPTVPRLAGAPALSGASSLTTPTSLGTLAPTPLLAPNVLPALPALLVAPQVRSDFSAAFTAAADAPKLSVTAGLSESVLGAQEALKAGDAGQARAVGATTFDAAAALTAPADGPSSPRAQGPEERRPSGLSAPTDAELVAAFEAARPRSKARAIIPSEQFTAAAVDMLMQYTFVSRGFLDELASHIPFFDRRGQAFLAAAKEFVAVHDAKDPASRRFVELAGRWYAFAEAQNEKRWREGAPVYGSVPPHMPPSPLPEGEYWDMAAGLNAGRYVRRPEVDKTTPYVMFDRSPFAVSYIRTSAELAGKTNVTAREEDLLRIAKPAAPLAVLRTKNAVAYVPGFEKKLEEMADWIAPGGQLIIQTDPGPGRHEFIIEKHERLIRRLIKQGWTFGFGFAGTRGKFGEYGYDTLSFTRPTGMTNHLGPDAVEKAWKAYTGAVAYAYRRGGLRF